MPKWLTQQRQHGFAPLLFRIDVPVCICTEHPCWCILQNLTILHPLLYACEHHSQDPCMPSKLMQMSVTYVCDKVGNKVLKYNAGYVQASQWQHANEQPDLHQLPPDVQWHLQLTRLDVLWPEWCIWHRQSWLLHAEHIIISGHCWLSGVAL